MASPALGSLLAASMLTRTGTRRRPAGNQPHNLGCAIFGAQERANAEQRQVHLDFKIAHRGGQNHKLTRDEIASRYSAAFGSSLW